MLLGGGLYSPPCDGKNWCHLKGHNRCVLQNAHNIFDEVLCCCKKDIYYWAEQIWINWTFDFIKVVSKILIKPSAYLIIDITNIFAANKFFNTTLLNFCQ